MNKIVVVLFLLVFGFSFTGYKDTTPYFWGTGWPPDITLIVAPTPTPGPTEYKPRKDCKSDSEYNYRNYSSMFNMYYRETKKAITMFSDQFESANLAISKGSVALIPAIHDFAVRVGSDISIKVNKLIKRGDANNANTK